MNMRYPKGILPLENGAAKYNYALVSASNHPCFSPKAATIF
jgi:hypothetical protein